MKKILILALIIVSTSFNAQEIKWMSFEKAVEAQKTVPKKIFIDFYTVWCGPCKMLDRDTFSNPDLAAYLNTYYYAVKFNAEGNEIVKFKGNTFTNPNFDPKKSGRNSPHQLSSAFGVRAFPTLVFLDEEANFLLPLTGFQTSQQLELYLKLFKSDTHKNIKSKQDWENYTSNFKPVFK